MAEEQRGFSQLQMDKQARMHGQYLSRGAQPFRQGAQAPALLSLCMNELGKGVDTEVTSSASTTCLG